MVARALGRSLAVACALGAAACGTSGATQQLGTTLDAGAAGGTIDAGAGGVTADAGQPSEDAGTGAAADAGNAADAGGPADAGTVATDGGTVATDGGTAATDGGTVAADAGNGGTTTTLTPAVPPGVERLTTGESGVALAVDAASLYWLSQIATDQPGDAQVVVRTSARAGGAAQTLATVTGIANAKLFADADALYFTVLACDTDPADEVPCGLVGGGASLVSYRVAKAGGGATVLKSGDDEQTVIGAQANKLYLSRAGYDFDPGSVEVAATDGSGEVAIDDSRSVALVATPTDLYWLGFDDASQLNALRHRAIGGTADDTVATFATLNLGDLALGGQFFFLRATLEDQATSGIYALPHAGGAPALLWSTTDTYAPVVSAGGGQVFWNQDPAPLSGFAGCAGAANPDGSNGRCIDSGTYRYGPVLADGADLFYLRDGDVFHAPVNSPADPDSSDGEWLERASAVPPTTGNNGAASGTLYTSANSIDGLSLGANTVYFSTDSAPYFAPTSADLLAVPKSGGAAAALAHVQGSIGQVDVTADFVYFAELAQYSSSFTGLRRFSKGGGALEWLGDTYRHVVDGDFIYFDLSSTSASTLQRMDLAGQNRATVATVGYLAAYTASFGEVIWIEQAAPDGEAGLLRAAPEDGSGPARTIANLDGFSNLGGISADASNVFFIRDGTLYSVSRKGGTPLALGSAVDNALAVYGGRVYWSQDTFNGSTSPPGCLYSANPDGSGQVCLDTSSEVHSFVQADEESVYFVRGKSIIKVVRK